MRDTWITRDLLNIIKSIFISFEFLVLIIMYVVYFLKVVPFDKIGVFLFGDQEIVRWITLALPISLFLFSIKYQKALLQPEENNKILYNWPDYKLYRMTTYVGIFFCLLPILPTFISWVKFSYYCKYDIGFYYILLLAISFISLASIYHSQFEIKRVLQK